MRPTKTTTGSSRLNPTARRAWRSVAGPEEGVVHAGGDDGDAGRVGAVEVGQLVGLDGAADARTTSEQPMMSALGEGPPGGLRRRQLLALASAFTRSRVWKVDTSGTSSSCLRVWPATPDSQ